METEPGAPMSRTRLYGILGLVALVLIAVGMSAKPVYHKFKTWRALQLTEASAVALRSNDIGLARQKAQAAVELWPFDARVFRQAAKVTDAIDPTKSLPLWQETLVFSDDPADRRQVIFAAISANKLQVALDEFKILQHQEPDNPLTWFASAQLEAVQLHWDKALADLKRVLASGKAPDEAQMLYAEATQHSPDPTVQAEGIDHLRELSTRTDRLGLISLRALTNFKGNSFLQIEDIAQLLQNHPLATADDKLMALKLRGQLPGADNGALLDAARVLFPPGDMNGLVTVSRWLNSQQRYEEVLTLVDSQTAMTRRDLMVIRLDAMSGMNQWAAIQEVLQRPNLPLDEPVKLLFQAETLSALGRTSESTALAWEKARLAMADDTTQLGNLAHYALHWGQDETVRAIYQQLVKEPNPQLKLDTFKDWVTLERRVHHTQALHDVLGDLLNSFPDNVDAQSDFLYTGFLLGEDGPDKIETAKKLVADHPEMLAYRITLATGLLLNNQPKDAIDVFDNIAVNWSQVDIPWRVVFAAVLRANGHMVDAQDLEKLIPTDNLLPEEKTLLTDKPMAATQAGN